MKVFRRAKDALKQCLPDSLKDQTFAAALATEDSVQKWLALLLKNINESPSIASGSTSVPQLSTRSAYSDPKKDSWN